MARQQHEAEASAEAARRAAELQAAAQALQEVGPLLWRRYIEANKQPTPITVLASNALLRKERARTQGFLVFETNPNRWDSDASLNYRLYVLPDGRYVSDRDARHGEPGLTLAYCNVPECPRTRCDIEHYVLSYADVVKLAGTNAAKAMIAYTAGRLEA